MKVRKALAWESCNKLNKLWKLSLCKSLKLQTFLLLVESVLLHGKPNRGRKRKTYLDNLVNDTNMERVDELQSLMMDRHL